MDSRKIAIEPPTPLSTPVVLIMFNRPQLAILTLEAIRKVRPKKLFVIIDGPRSNRPNDKGLVESCRNLLALVDWPCDLVTISSSSNMGCRDRISSGLTEVFRSVDRAIILEDDCLPNISFFYFTQELLERFKDEPRIGLIAGTSTPNSNSEIQESYYFTKHAQIWGWATWSRVWSTYDVDIKEWPKIRKSSFLKENLHTKRARATWRQNFNLVFSRKLNTWDYQLVFNLWKHNLLSVTPSSNLISNLGFGAEATHTYNSSSPFSALPTVEIGWPIIHPKSISTKQATEVEIESTRSQRSGPARFQLSLFFLLPSALRDFASQVFARFKTN